MVTLHRGHVLVTHKPRDSQRQGLTTRGVGRDGLRSTLGLNVRAAGRSAPASMIPLTGPRRAPSRRPWAPAYAGCCAPHSTSPNCRPTFVREPLFHAPSCRRSACFVRSVISFRYLHAHTSPIAWSTRDLTLESEGLTVTSASSLTRSHRTPQGDSLTSWCGRAGLPRSPPRSGCRPPPSGGRWAGRPRPRTCTRCARRPRAGPRCPPRRAEPGPGTCARC